MWAIILLSTWGAMAVIGLLCYCFGKSKANAPDTQVAAGDVRDDTMHSYVSLAAGYSADQEMTIEPGQPTPSSTPTTAVDAMSAHMSLNSNTSRGRNVIPLVRR